MEEKYNEPIELSVDVSDLIVEMPTQELADDSEDGEDDEQA